MDHYDVARHWNENAEAWTKLSRAGYDVYRDGLNTPAFLELLPDVAGQRGLDVGCGEGHNTRLLAERGARVTAIDVSSVFIRHARDSERRGPLGINYLLGSAVELPFAGASFDFLTGFMSFMDVPGPERVLAEAHRVLRPGGFLQFSIEHPCFALSHRKNLRGPDGLTYGYELANYFSREDGRIAEWIFSSAPPEVKQGMQPFRIPTFHRTMGDWLNMLIDAGFVIERVAEPRPTDEAVRRYPKLQDAQVIAYFLHLRARKLATPR